MLKEHASILNKSQKIIDILMLISVFFVCNYIFKDHNKLTIQTNFINIKTILLPAVIFELILFNKNTFYKSQRFIKYLKKTIKIIHFSFYQLIFLIGINALINLDIFKLYFIAIFIIINTIFLITKDLVTFKLRDFFRKKGYNTRNIILVGSMADLKKATNNINQNTWWGLKIIGNINISDELTKINNHPIQPTNIILNKKNHKTIIREMLNKNTVDFIVITVSPWEIAKVKHIIEFCIIGGIPVKMTANFFEGIPYVSTNLENHENHSFITFLVAKRNVYEIAIKEIIDKFLGFISIFLLLPIFLFICLLIKLLSKGSIFFKQIRVGKNGKKFVLYKFRTMVVSAEKQKNLLLKNNEMNGPVFKIKDDPRVTKIGKLLRKTSLDELPQLINVIKGDMSLVGPRPPLPEEVISYNIFQRRRLSVKPGITCSWQVSGRNKINFENWVNMDLEYIDKWSLKTDASLLIKTIPAVIFQKGAS